ncbi:MAG TPA: hypothetical protein VIN10_06150 [Bacteroidales bacterium]
MKTGIKIFANATLMLGLVGFVSYLFLIFAGFLGCCLEISSLLFEKITLLTILAAGFVFTLGMYNNCCRSNST